MPMAFGSLIGGTITLVGTSPNLLISTVRQNLGQPPLLQVPELNWCWNCFFSLEPIDSSFPEN